MGTETHLVPRDEAHKNVEQPARRPVLEEAEVLGESRPLNLSQHHEHAKQDTVDAQQNSTRCGKGKGKGKEKEKGVGGRGGGVGGVCSCFECRSC